MSRPRNDEIAEWCARYCEAKRDALEAKWQAAFGAERAGWLGLYLRAVDNAKAARQQANVMKAEHIVATVEDTQMERVA